jgi:hypothetical protein
MLWEFWHGLAGAAGEHNAAIQGLLQIDIHGIRTVPKVAPVTFSVMQLQPAVASKRCMAAKAACAAANGIDKVPPLVRLLDPAPPEPVHPLVRRAAYLCPAGAITLAE